MLKRFVMTIMNKLPNMKPDIIVRMDQEWESWDTDKTGREFAKLVEKK